MIIKLPQKPLQSEWKESHSSQTGYVKEKYIGESIRTITDIMSFTKTQNIPGLAASLDFEKAFDSIESEMPGNFKLWSLTAAVD